LDHRGPVDAWNSSTSPCQICDLGLMVIETVVEWKWMSYDKALNQW
jgi:hypothetical protein